VASVVDRPVPVEQYEPGQPVAVATSRPVHDPLVGSAVESAIIERQSLGPGDTVAGPAVIVEAQTTTVLGSHHVAVVQGDHSLRIGRSAALSDHSADAGGALDTSVVSQQIMWNRLVAVVEEQALTLVRTSFSTSVREAGDLSAGVFDASGRLVAQAVTGTPGHVNTMAAAVGHFISDIGRERMFDGDVYITNDPWKGTGHLHDITVTTPVFRGESLIGFFASTSHVVDVGGRGYGPDGHEIYEEGIRIPIMKWAQRGELNDDLVNIIRTNVREPDQVVGDIHGLAAANETGRRRLLEMLDEFRLDDIDGLALFVFERTTQAVMSALAEVPGGTYRNSMDVDGYDEPVHLEVTLTVDDGGMHADFSGTSGTSRFGINVPVVYAQAYFTYGMIVALAPELPNNFASLAPFTVSAPPGVILNAEEPEPVSVRHVIGHFVTDLCLGALAQGLPERIPAEGAGALWNFQASARSADPMDNPLPPIELLMFNSGGSGGRPTLDGLTATAFPSGVMTMSAEATEQVGPIVVWRKEIRENSGGSGRQRGGLGQIIEISATDGYLFEFSAMFDRVEHPARGRHGGANGAAGRVYLDDGSPFRAKGKQTIPADRRLVLELPGGGGWGDPGQRDPAAVANDEAQGYVS
jgi:N-methylhydantoinase B